jgi:MFS family permease
MGFGSLFMDTSSEWIHSLLPLFMVDVLGASMVTVGLLEGLAEGTASVVKVFSGALSDRLGRRKALMVTGYGLAALTKPIFPLAGSVGWVFAARFLDRVGKGIRGAPRDALVAELAASDARGAAYGLRQALDSVGAVLGPLLAFGLLAWLADDLRTAMWFAVVPAILSVAVLVRFVHEPPKGVAPPPRVPLRLAELRSLPARFWAVVALGAVFSLARFSEAFLLLRAQDVGVALGWVPLVMVLMNVLYAAAAWPAGALADRLPARGLLLAGLGLLIGADLALAAAPSPELVLVGAGLWGLHLALTQGLLSKLVADAAPEALRGTGFGVYHLFSGLALVGASTLAGGLWSSWGPEATFLVGAGFAGMAALGLLVVRGSAA